MPMQLTLGLGIGSFCLALCLACLAFRYWRNRKTAELSPFEQWVAHYDSKSAGVVSPVHAATIDAAEKCQPAPLPRNLQGHYSKSDKTSGNSSWLSSVRGLFVANADQDAAATTAPASVSKDQGLADVYGEKQSTSQKIEEHAREHVESMVIMQSAIISPLAAGTVAEASPSPLSAPPSRPAEVARKNSVFGSYNPFFGGKAADGGGVGNKHVSMIDKMNAASTAATAAGGGEAPKKSLIDMIPRAAAPPLPPRPAQFVLPTAR